MVINSNASNSIVHVFILKTPPDPTDWNQYVSDVMNSLCPEAIRQNPNIDARTSTKVDDVNASASIAVIGIQFGADYLNDPKYDIVHQKFGDRYGNEGLLTLVYLRS